jgi:general secretion pathway protein D
MLFFFLLLINAPAQDAVKKAVADTATVKAEDDSSAKPEAADSATAGDGAKEAASADKAKPKTKAKSKDAETKTPDKSSDEIQLSFQGANIEMIVQWLAQNTGKSVLKHPRVQCQLTIVSSKKVTKREALTLIYRALALEGFSTIESSKAILIVPEGSEPKLSPELLSPSRSDIPEGREKLIKIFPLKHTQAADVKERIKSVLSEKSNVDIDERANQIIVTDYTENLSLAAGMIEALDSDKPQDVSLRVIPVKNVSAQDLVKEITPLYQKMASKGSKEVVEVSANDRSNSLLILSSEANFKSIQSIVAMLDTEEAQERVMRAFPLKNAEAGDVAKQLTDLYQDQDTTQRSPYFYFPQQSAAKNSKKLNVVADRRRNTVIVQAPPAVMENIEKMITTLDEPATDDSLAPKIYPLKYVSAGDIEDILNELFLKKQQARSYWNPYDGSQESSWADRDVGKLYGKVRITSEPHSNALIITGNSAENLAAVEAIIKQLDVPSEAGETTFRIALNFSKASTVANSINILFAKNGSPGIRAVTQPGQPANPNAQQAQQQNQNNSNPSNFELEQDAKEEGYFPWLGGQPDVQRGGDSRNTTRPVSDLVGRVRVVADQRSNCLLISANVHFFPQVIKLIEELDVPTAQVLIEARIVEVSSDFLDKLGVRWSPDGSKVFTADDFDNSFLLKGKGEYLHGFGAAIGNVGGPAAALANSLHSGVIDSTINLDFLIQFLRRTTDATVLAQPQINIADNEVGRLFVGQQVPFIDKTLSTDVGGLNQSFSYKNVGVILEVTPHINSSGEVALRIRTESSSIVPGQTLFGGAILDTRNFKTDLTARDGETLVLGGIIQKQASDILRKTPILGDIPGLKWAFNKKDKTTRDVELMVFLRPKVVRTPDQAQELLKEIDQRAPRVKKWQDDAQPKQDDKKKKRSKT